MLNLNPYPATIRPARRMESFKATIVTNEDATDKLQITKHRVQQGAKISDHAVKEPAQVVIKMFYDEINMGLPLSEIYSRLLALQMNREPFDVVTGKRIYKNMLIETLVQNTDHATENVLSITATLQEVIIVNTSISTVPARSKHKNPGATGATEKAAAKKAQKVDGTLRRSALQQMSEMFGGGSGHYDKGAATKALTDRGVKF